MSHASAPRRIERLLEALGAETDFRDGVIGDLAEEYALRVEWDGAASARRWYRREALRVVPYLLRDWARGLRWQGARHLAGAVIASSACVIVVESIFGAVVRGAIPALGRAFPMLAPWLQGPFGAVAIPATMVLWTVADGAFVGVLAAHLNRRAPLPTVLSTCVALTGALVAVNAIAYSSSIVPLWFQIANTLALATGILAGGIAHASRDAARD